MRLGILSFVNWTNMACTKVQRTGAQYTRKQTETKFWTWCDVMNRNCYVNCCLFRLINYRLLLLFNCLRIQSISVSVLWHIHYNVVFSRSHSSFSWTLAWKSHGTFVIQIGWLAGDMMHLWVNPTVPENGREKTGRIESGASVHFARQFR